MVLEYFCSDYHEEYKLLSEKNYLNKLWVFGVIKKQAIMQWRS